MPTGYTEPILKGKITNFKDYAKLCMRAFGATIHMRDESLDVEYSKREPSQYYIDSLKSWEEKLMELKSMTDEQIMEKRRNEIQNDIEYHQKKVKECRENFAKLKPILDEVQSWEPPTEEHTGIKTFMTEQITQTMKFDTDARYHELEIKNCTEKLNSLDIDDVKSDYLVDAERNIKYHISNNDDEIKRANDTNKWVETFLNSL